MAINESDKQIIDALVKVDKRILKWYLEAVDNSFKDEYNNSENYLYSHIHALIDMEDKLLSSLNVDEKKREELLKYMYERYACTTIPILSSIFNPALAKETYPYHRILAKCKYIASTKESSSKSLFMNVGMHEYMDIETKILYKSLFEKVGSSREKDDMLARALKMYSIYALMDSKEAELDAIENYLVPSEDIYNQIPLILDYKLIDAANFVAEKIDSPIGVSIDQCDISYRAAIIKRLNDTLGLLFTSLQVYIKEYPSNYDRSPLYHSLIAYIKTLISLGTSDIREHTYETLMKTNEEKIESPLERLIFKKIIEEARFDIENNLVPSVKNVSMHNMLP